LVTLSCLDDEKWVSSLERYISTNELTREMVLAFVERIEVDGDLKVHIRFRFQDEYAKLAEFITKNGGSHDE
jgi:hypothetical protein